MAWDLPTGDVAAGPVLSPAEVLADPHLNARGMFGSTSAAGRAYRYVAQPLRASALPPRTPAPAPARGEHTEAILRELGCGDEELATLRRAGAI